MPKQIGEKAQRKIFTLYQEDIDRLAELSKSTGIKESALIRLLIEEAIKARKANEDEND